LAGQVYRGTTAGPVCQSAGVLSTNTWTHVAMTVDGTGIIRLYKNGSQVVNSAASGANIPLVVTRSLNYFGKSNFSGNPNLNGYLADVSVWTGAQPITMTTPATGAAGLCGLWKCNEGSGTVINDTCTNAKIGN